MKNLRRNCDNPKCRKQYRYHRATSEYCSTTCRKDVSRERKAVEDKVASDARMVELGEQARQIAQQIAKLKAEQAEQEPQSPDPDPRPLPPKPPKPPKPISRLFPPPKEKPASITIRNVPTRFPGTPLRGKW